MSSQTRIALSLRRGRKNGSMQITLPLDFQSRRYINALSKRVMVSGCGRVMRLMKRTFPEEAPLTGEAPEMISDLKEFG